MKKIFKMLVIILLIATLGATYLMTRRPKTVEVAVPITQNTSAQLSAIREKIDQLYTNSEEKFFLVKDEIKQEDLNALRDEVLAGNEKSPEKNKLLTEIEIVEWKLKARDAVNAIYTSEKNGLVIEGDKVAGDIVLANELTIEDVKDYQTELNKHIPTRLLDNSEEVQEDKFNALALKMVDDAVVEIENFTQAQTKLKEIDQMKIEDGQIGNIAKAMREFETILAKVNDKNFKKKLEESVEQFVEKFMAAFKELEIELPGYYEIVKVAIEPSKFLTQALELYAAEVTTIETSEIIYVEETEVTYEIVTYSQVVTVATVTTVTTATVSEVTEPIEPPTETEISVEESE